MNIKKILNLLTALSLFSLPTLFFTGCDDGPDEPIEDAIDETKDAAEEAADEVEDATN